MATRKIDGWWCVDLRTGQKRYRKRSPQNTCGSARSYELFLRAEIAKMGSLEHLSSKHSMQQETPKATFAEFVERWMRDYVDVKNKWSERASKRYKLNRHLLPALGSLRLSEITTLRIDQYVATKRRERLCAKTINNHLTIIRKCLVKAVDWGELVQVPRFEFLETQTPDTHFLSFDEATNLLVACSPDPWRLMIFTAIRTGLRFSELIALEWMDLNLDARFLSVRRGDVSGHIDAPKTKKSARMVPLTADLVEALRVAPHHGVQVFMHKGKRITYGSAWWHLTKACRRAGIDHTSWHPLRHTFASHLSIRGVSLRPIQDLLGHTTIRMTERYTHLPAEHLREVVSVLEPPTRQPWAAPWAAGGQEGQIPPVENTKTPVITGVPGGSP